MAKAKSTRFDVIVFGATSFVGQILCRYLLEQFGVADAGTGTGSGAGARSKEKLRWAAAGRSLEKLEALRASLGSAATDLPLQVADAADETALRALCVQTRVLVSTVGPYALYGEPLVKVCCETGTDYCDLTGETPWIGRMIAAHEAAAKASGARIVHCCGFDSIPSDLGVWTLQQAAVVKFAKPCTEVKMRVKAMKGGASGGTVASLLNVVREAATNPALRRELANPYSLCPPESQPKLRQRSVNGAAYDTDFNAWCAPFVMAAINTRVVFRSNAITKVADPAKFKYDEAMLTGEGVKGRLSALGLAGGLGGFVVAAALPPSRWLLEKFVLPAPGDGPSPEAQENGFFDLRFFGRTEDGQTLRVKVTGDRDPGYGSTAKMLGQAAACLANDISKSEKPGGFWTPATIFGEALVTRLVKDAGLTFIVDENSDA